MKHPDFRVRGKIFATLHYPDKNWGMVRLTPGEQAMFVESEPEAFRPCAGAWGRAGCTSVRLAAVGKDRKSTRLNSSHIQKSRMPSSA